MPTPVAGAFDPAGDLTSPGTDISSLNVPGVDAESVGTHAPTEGEEMPPVAQPLFPDTAPGLAEAASSSTPGGPAVRLPTLRAARNRARSARSARAHSRGRGAHVTTAQLATPVQPTAQTTGTAQSPWSTFIGSPAPTPAPTDPTIQVLMATVAAMQESINTLTKQLMETKKYEVAGAPRMDHKDLKDPSEFNGNHFVSWSEDFITHVRLRDRRWEPLLKGIKERSKSPLSEMDGAALMAEADIASNEILQVFQQQLYVYLKKFTSGEPASYVLAGGPEGAFEAWRRMCDQGASRRDRSMRDERRSIWHPEPLKESQLLAGIEAWENRLAKYLKVKREDAMSTADKLMALEDMCPLHLQKHLALLEAQGQIASEGDKAYAEHKAALEQWFLDEQRWNKKAGIRSFAEAAAAGAPQAESQPATAEGEEATDENETYHADFMQQLFALVNNKFGKGKGQGKFGKGKGKGKAANEGAGGDGDVNMGDAQAKPKGNCYECGEGGHYGRDCPVRKARIAAGGPAILDKGKSKGGKNGQGNQPQQWPTQKQWRVMYPGPSPTQWSQWYPQKGGGGKSGMANMMTEQSPLMQLFQPGSMFSFTEKKKTKTPSLDKSRPIPGEKPFTSPNRFKVLTISEDFESSKDCLNCENCQNPKSHLKGPDKLVENVNVDKAVRVDIKDLVLGPSRNELKRFRRRERRDMERRQDLDDYEAMKEATVAHDGSGVPSESPPMRCSPKPVSDLRIVQPPDARAERLSGPGDPHHPLGDSMEAIKKLVQFGQDDFDKEFIKNATNLRQSLKVFLQRPVDGMLAPMVPKQSVPGEWELIKAVVDSGATVPAMPPSMGSAYPLEESLASRAGVEYECANGDSVANLGEKLMAVMTAEGTLRGYKTQCAKVSQPINAVRTMVAGKSAVCFGLGPDGDQHMIINRLTGEVNMIEDDGLNYIQNLWVVPPDRVGPIQSAMNDSQHFAGPGQ